MNFIAASLLGSSLLMFAPRESFSPCLLSVPASQDMAYFDTVAVGGVATHIQTDTRTPTFSPSLPYLMDLVEEAMPEKLTLVMNFIAAFLTGFILAYVRSWRVVLSMSSIHESSVQS